MPIYKAPVDDYMFLLYELFNVQSEDEIPGYADLSPDLVSAVLEGGAKIAEEVLFPLNQIGDEEGCHLENGVVRTPKGFKEAFKEFNDGGWNRLGASEEMGGAGLPGVVSFAVTEMMTSANQAFTMYPGLTMAAYSALQATGEPWMKEHVVSRMVEGDWTGTMCLTEPHCGTDLKLMKTKAVEQEDGTYRLTGTKIFISGGDHDMTDNIIHMVIAKIPDEDGKLQDDLSTVNFFMVPKVLVNPEDGSLMERNNVSVGSVEKKMGIKGNATCVMNFDDAVAYRLGPKPQKKSEGGEKKRSASAGMRGMFGMMNGARMGVGLQGIAIGEIAYQNAAAYAKDRLAGRALTGAENPEGPADPILVHPDVRRMLLKSRAFVEGARALFGWTSILSSKAFFAKDEEERQDAAALSNLMTPIIKAYFTDLGFEAANNSLQCFGGHGYIREHGMEQYVRDARINQVYEGANGVQALDLVGRKLNAAGGRGPMAFFKAVDDFVAENEGNADMKEFTDPLKRASEDLKQATFWLAENGLKDPNNAAAASTDYLHMFGTVALGLMWGRMAKVSLAKLTAGEGNPDFYKGKIVRARFWAERALPDTASQLMRATAGADNLMELAEDAF
ncbi:MAG: acyl-CoA dehydrogenase [Alphaproteobacteria bacterium]|nr:MAG: acyl-CoA dehydrogenase [Alphaproteobacteria bacterium]